MKPGHSGRREQKAVVFVAAFENMLAGHYEVAFPAGIASVVILLVNVWMLIGLNRLDAGE